MSIFKNYPYLAAEADARTMGVLVKFTLINIGHKINPD